MVRGKVMDDSIWVGQHFQAKEFRCPCCGANTVSHELVKTLDMVRKKLGTPIRINSAVRCVAHNKSVGGAVQSYHIPREGIGYAADITFGRIYNKALPLNIIRLFITATDILMGKGGIILYPAWVHVDMRHELECNPYRDVSKFAWPRIS